MPTNRKRDKIRSFLRDLFNRRSSHASGAASSTGTDDTLQPHTVVRESKRRAQTRPQSQSSSTPPEATGIGSFLVSDTGVASARSGSGGSNNASTPSIPTLSVQASAAGMSLGSSCNISAQSPTGLSLSPGSYSRSLWQDAFTTLSADNQALLSTHRDNIDTVLQLVLRDTRAQSIEYKRNEWSLAWRGKEFRMGDITDRIINWIERFVKVGDTIVQYDPGHAALPWAAVRFILQSTLNNRQAGAAALMGVERATNLIVKGRILEELYIHKGTMTEIKQTLALELVETYANILRFLAKAQRHMQQGGAGKFLSSVLDTGELAGLITLIENDGLRLSQTATLIESTLFAEDRGRLDAISQAGQKNTEIFRNLLLGLGDPIDRIGSKMDALYTWIEAGERNKILRWLSTVEYHSHHIDIQYRILENSGEWLFNRHEFQDWHTSAISRILWLHGIPGAGKTKLTSTIVQRLLDGQKILSSPTGPIGFFYCNRNEETRRLPQIVLASLLKQLVAYRDEIPNCVLSVYSERLKQGSERSLDVKECQKLIVDLTSIVPETTLIIDALDETSTTMREQLLESFKMIVTKSQNPVKIFISSREDRDIVQGMHDVPHIYISAIDNAPDIQRFIRRELEQNTKNQQLLGGRASAELRLLIEDTLTKKAHGMFQWVNLQMQYICEFKIQKDLVQNLGTLPETLHETYENMYRTIQQLKGSTPGLIEKALMWLMCSVQPLKPMHWQRAVQWTAQMDSLDGLPINELLHICRYLVRVDTDSGYVRFTHLSVREFLETMFSEGDAHCTAAEVLTALFLRNPHVTSECILAGPFQPTRKMSKPSHHFIDSPLPPDYDNQHDMVEDFEQYPLVNWIQHIALAVSRGGVTKGFVHTSAHLRRMCKPEFWVNSAMEGFIGGKFYNTPIFSPYIPLLIVSYVGLDPSKMGLWPPANFDDHRENTHHLLCASVEWGNEAMTRLILEHGVVDISLQSYLWHSLAQGLLAGHTPATKMVYDSCFPETRFPPEQTHLIVSIGELKLIEEFQRSFKTDVNQDLLVTASLRDDRAVDVLRCFWRTGDMADMQDAVLVAAIRREQPNIEVINFINDAGGFKLTEHLFAAAIAFDSPVHTEIILRVLPKYAEIGPSCSYLDIAAGRGLLWIFDEICTNVLPSLDDDHSRARLMMAARDGGNEDILQKCFQICGSFTELDAHGWEITSRHGELEIDLEFARMPSRWVGESSDFCKIDGCRIDYNGFISTPPILADHPLPPLKDIQGYYYFEVEILDVANDAELEIHPLANMHAPTLRWAKDCLFVGFLGEHSFSIATYGYNMEHMTAVRGDPGTVLGIWSDFHSSQGVSSNGLRISPSTGPSPVLRSVEFGSQATTALPQVKYPKPLSTIRAFPAVIFKPNTGMTIIANFTGPFKHQIPIPEE